MDTKKIVITDEFDCVDDEGKGYTVLECARSVAADSTDGGTGGYKFYRLLNDGTILRRA
jgi:hypothetical protein